MVKILLASWTLVVFAAIAPAQETPQAASNPNALSASQKQALQQAAQAAEKDVKVQAETLAKKVESIAKSIDRNALSEKPDAELDRKLSAEMAGALTELVSAAIQAKLATMREMVKVLTPEQKKVLLAEIEKPGVNPDLTELIGKVFGEKKK